MRIFWSVMFAGLLGLFCYAVAGELTPPGAPAPTMRSLDEIYNEVTSKLVPAEVPDYSQGTAAGAIHMALTGETQGAIVGSCTAAGREDTTVVVGYSHEVVSPRDAATGLPTGKRQHKPVTIVKYIDKATPLLYYALTNNENLPNVTFTFYRTGQSGAQMPYYTVELVNASIAGIRSTSANGETVEFVYQHITWTWLDGAITAEDDWETPVV